MKKYFIIPSIFLSVGIFLVILSSFLFLSVSQSEGEEELVSPVIEQPEIEQLFKENSVYDQINNEKTTDKYPPSEYFPTNLTPKENINLGLSAKAYAVMDRDTKELLLGSNITEQKQIASLTKVMTATVALEKEKLDHEIVVSKSASEIGEATMGLSAGERYSLEELLFGLLIVSGNDAAETIAQSVGRGRFWFIEEMNKKAVGLGLKDTYFVNPTGLDEESRETSSFSTALDLLGLTNFALNNQNFADIVSTKYHTIPFKEDYHKAIFLDNILTFDLVYPGIKGVKTGNTDFAGQTLISYAENKSRKILIVLLDSIGTRDDAVKIYRYVFEGIVSSTNNSENSEYSESQIIR